MDSRILKYFEITEENLFKCLECGTTFESEKECLRHLKESNIEV